MKPVFMDRHIDLHEEMLSKMQSSFGKVKKRIRRVEVAMHLKPPDEEVEEVKAWTKKVDRIIEKDKVDMLFPSLNEITRDWTKKHHPPIYLSNGQQIIFKKEQKRRAKARDERAMPLKSLKALMKSRDDKIFGATHNLGPSEVGHELKTIKNYKGCNTMYEKDSRTLVRKNGVMTTYNLKSSAPEWFAPGQYADNNDPVLMRKNASTIGCEAAFKATGRDVLTAEDHRCKKILSRARWDEGAVLTEGSAVPGQRTDDSYQVRTCTERGRTALSSSLFADEINEMSETRTSTSVNLPLMTPIKSASKASLTPLANSPPPPRDASTNNAVVQSSASSNTIRGFTTSKSIAPLTNTGTFEELPSERSITSAMQARAVGYSSPLSADMHSRRILLSGKVSNSVSEDLPPSDIPNFTSDNTYNLNISRSKNDPYILKDWTMGGLSASRSSTAASTMSIPIDVNDSEDASSITFITNSLNSRSVDTGLFSLLETEVEEVKDDKTARIQNMGSYDKSGSSGMMSTSGFFSPLMGKKSEDRGSGLGLGLVRSATLPSVASADGQDMMEEVYTPAPKFDKKKLYPNLTKDFKEGRKLDMSLRRFPLQHPPSRGKTALVSPMGASNSSAHLTKMTSPSTSPKKYSPEHSPSAHDARIVEIHPSESDSPRSLDLTNMSSMSATASYFDEVTSDADVGDALKAWYADNNIYSPMKPMSSSQAKAPFKPHTLHHSRKSFNRNASLLAEGSRMTDALANSDSLLLPGPGVLVDDFVVPDLG